jgi:hypothetical protein
VKKRQRLVRRLGKTWRILRQSDKWHSGLKFSKSDPSMASKKSARILIDGPLRGAIEVMNEGSGKRLLPLAM